MLVSSFETTFDLSRSIRSKRGEKGGGGRMGKKRRNRGDREEEVIEARVSEEKFESTDVSFVKRRLGLFDRVTELVNSSRTRIG